MEIKILQEKLQKAVSQIEKIAGKDATLPILNNIMIVAKDKTLSVCATNLETGAVWDIAAKIEGEGAVVLPAQIFSGLVNSFSGGTLAVKNDNGSVSIINDRQKSKLNSIPADEFPVIPIDLTGDCATINANLFCEAISCVANFTGNSSIKPEITGVYLSFQKNNLKFVATDSFRLGEKTIQISNYRGNLNNYSIIIPSRAAREIVSIFGGVDKNINIYFNQNQITVELLGEGNSDYPAIKYISRLIEGDFPDYQAIIPASCEGSAVFSKKEILAHLKSAGLFAGKNNEVGVKISNKDCLMSILSQSSDLGGYESELKLIGVSGKDASVTLNCRFLVDGLNSIKNDKCLIEFSGDDGPCVLKSPENNDFFYILMPIKKY